MSVAALYVDTRRGPYLGLDVDCWGVERDAATYRGPHPVVSHPPCGPWSRLYGMCNRRTMQSKGLGIVAVRQVRRWGGVLEHPSHSTLWDACSMPKPNGFFQEVDQWGGWTLPVEQWWWGHDAIKPTWLYIVGTHTPPPIHNDGRRRPVGRNAGGRLGNQERSMVERMYAGRRHLTPPAFAEWLVDLASRCRRDDADDDAVVRHDGGPRG